MATFPYHPTTVLSSPVSKNIIYVFRPATDSQSNPQFLALNASTSLNHTKLAFETISPTLPFLTSSQNDVYSPAIDDAGNILVHTGSCYEKAQGTAFWQFKPLNESSKIGGTWQEQDLSIKSSTNLDTLDGANYLASAIAFSTTVNATSDMYIFGGMCPNTTSSTAQAWTENAQYSDSMLSITPSQSSTASTPFYEFSLVSSRGPPIAEAGLTITPLQPTFFSSGKNNATASQNQNFVLLGGHTQTAFINMSQIALFSLPEQSWTFLPVDAPSPEPNTDLATRDQPSVDSRSGHTALLTSDGKRVIVFGGWVGDVTTAADPQLAVLELGEGYGGNGDWQWTIPQQTGPGLASGAGIYGHGASMLAGDVMIVIGGYQIPASDGSSGKRDNNPAASGDVYFFNITSSTWVTSYTHPRLSKGHRPIPSDGGGSKENAKRAELGAGVTLGLLAIIAAIVFLFWYRRRLQRQRNAREAELRNLADASHHLQLLAPSQCSPDRSAHGMTSVDWAPDSQQYPIRSRGEPEAERTGLLFEIPSPTRGLRRSLHSRSTYQPTSRFEDGRRGPGLSTIHPIDEREEFEEDVDGGSRQPEMIQREDYNILTDVPILDPFRDPANGSRTPSPQSPQDREMEIRNWVSDWTAADAMLHSSGRLSPERNDRTSSTLSDRSARSGLSSHSYQQSAGSISRSLSQRSAALFSSAPVRPTNEITTFDGQRPPSEGYGHRRSQSLTLFPNRQRADTEESYGAAVNSLPQAQHERETLLGDYPHFGEPSPTRSTSRARAWMGSMRRIFTGTDRGISTSPENNASTASSPTKHVHADDGLPRRAASTGGMFWQKRQGAKDWDVEGSRMRGEISAPNNQDINEDEWDVESAVERRVVQVMFTVPKDKLRVVNRGPEGDGESILSSEVKEAEEGGNDDEKRKGKEKE
ncbi:hypothetical protein MMC21_007288 [Puttea exsequens]|nr:hypothetical protein [Puttea exsequens]